MADYIVAKNREHNIGIIGLSTAVFESIAAFSLEDISGIKVVPSTRFKKNVTCKVEEGKININLNVTVKTGNNINEICRKVQNHIVNVIDNMTDFNDVVVNLDVRGFYI
ncbi:MAG TPA: Asp23/Gls24 family envelope stress response protein [Bacteroidales bacterium]|nr:Asp23/Gls24 family envelope stress response protein [Erysipelotrichia bacterium]HPX46146.1 Asp23/Gls24 family envelope stress response protein [Bacteroidales bacterium]HQA85317.1 Asp23/Gls24 family envelope stress response protein [Erysipelotrichaceae bacterium]